MHANCDVVGNKYPNSHNWTIVDVEVVARVRSRESLLAAWQRRPAGTKFVGKPWCFLRLISRAQFISLALYACNGRTSGQLITVLLTRIFRPMCDQSVLTAKLLCENPCCDGRATARSCGVLRYLVMNDPASCGLSFTDSFHRHVPLANRTIARLSNRPATPVSAIMEWREACDVCA